MKRTNYAGDTNEQQVGQEVVLKGWVAKRRNLGGLIFIDLWDREGIVQLVFNEKENPEAKTYNINNLESLEKFLEEHKN